MQLTGPRVVHFLGLFPWRGSGLSLAPRNCIPVLPAADYLPWYRVRRPENNYQPQRARNRIWDLPEIVEICYSTNNDDDNNK